MSGSTKPQSEGCMLLSFHAYNVTPGYSVTKYIICHIFTARHFLVMEKYFQRFCALEKKRRYKIG